LEKKVATKIMLTLLFIGTVTLAFGIRGVKASGTIYIRSDGSIEPSTAPISTADYVTYTFADNINDSIVVERNNILIDGDGYTLQGKGVFPSNGIDLTGRTNVTVRNTKIKNFWYGIRLDGSYGNIIYHNNFDNAQQVLVSASGYANVWDDDYPSGGNYWSDYNGTDANQDGIGNTQYIIDANNVDRYPLMGPFNTFDASGETKTDSWWFTGIPILVLTVIGIATVILFIKAFKTLKTDKMRHS